ncbi:MAG: hypothetical protein PHV37_01820 [Candidatus Gastranaerophilales bacterium]|nr:hypothetical protein [Candidatus Gastranaerophilales bacterium]
MAKKEQYYVLAEKYYVEEQIPVTGIAKKLNITEKTLHNWRKEGEWDDKRTKFLRSQCNCYSSLYELLNKLIAKVTESIANDEKIDGSTLYFIKTLMDKLPKLKKFENDLILDKLETSSTEESNEDIATKVAELVDKRLMGG